MLLDLDSPKTQYVGLVGCGKKKRSCRCSAENLYLGGPTREAIRWIKRNCSSWGILSAKYGFLLPSEEIDPYELSLDSLSSKERAEWGSRTSQRIADKFGRTTFLCIAKNSYLENLGLEVLSVFSNFGTFGPGLRMKWLKQNPILTPRVMEKIEKGKI